MFSILVYLLEHWKLVSISIINAVSIPPSLLYNPDKQTNTQSIKRARSIFQERKVERAPFKFEERKLECAPILMEPAHWSALLKNYEKFSTRFNV